MIRGDWSIQCDLTLIVEALSRRSGCALAHLRMFSILVVSQLSLALTDALTSSSQDSSLKSQHTARPYSRIVDVPVPQILEQIVIESKRK